MRVSQRIAVALLAGVMSMTLAAAASAQKGQKGQQAQKRQAAAVAAPAMLQRLDLSQDQQASVKAATAAYKAELQKVQSLSTPKEKRQARMQAANAYQASLKSILTPAQQTKLTAMLAEAREMGPLGARFAGLDLTGEQKEKIRAIHTRYQPEIQKLRAQQKGSTDKAALRGQVQDLNRKMNAEIMTVLTPEQQKQLTPARGARKAKR